MSDSRPKRRKEHRHTATEIRTTGTRTMGKGLIIWNRPQSRVKTKNDQPRISPTSTSNTTKSARERNANRNHKPPPRPPRDPLGAVEVVVVECLSEESQVILCRVAGVRGMMWTCHVVLFPGTSSCMGMYCIIVICDFILFS